MSEPTAEKPPFSYKGSVSGLKGLLTGKLVQGIGAALNSLDRLKEGVKEGAQSIPIEFIYPCPDQPRQVFDPKSLEELSQTLREVGQAQAITVRKTEQGYEIISGERRYRAAKLAGLKELDCVIKDCGREEARLLSLVENLQREDLLPIEEAYFLKNVLDENPDLNLEKLAKMIGTHKSTLSEKIQLTEVPEDLQPFLYSRGRSFTHRHWRVLSRIKDPKLLGAFVEETIERQLSVSELEKKLLDLGIEKSPRSKRAESSAEGRKKAFRGLITKAGDEIKIKGCTLDIKKMSPSERGLVLLELESLLNDLRAAQEI